MSAQPRRRDVPSPDAADFVAQIWDPLPPGADGAEPEYAYSMTVLLDMTLAQALDAIPRAAQRRVRLTCIAFVGTHEPPTVEP